MSHTAKDILALEDQRYAAMIAVDKAALERLFHDELVYTHSSAAIDSKASFIASMGAKYRYTAAKRSEEVVRFYGDTALVSGRAVLNVTVDGDPRVLNIAFLAVWVKTAAGWRFTAWQSCKLPV